MQERGGRRIEIIVNEYLCPKVNCSKVEVLNTGLHRPSQAVKIMIGELSKRKMILMPIEYELEREIGWLIGHKKLE